MAEPITIPKLIARILDGTIRIPAFQRGFVWKTNNIAFLMDSIYRGYPVGNLLFWRTKNQLNNEKQLGPFKLPDPQKDYPIDYVLDGQQRLTSIFGVFQSSLAAEKNSDWFDIYYDLEAASVEDQFVPLAPADVVPGRHISLRVLFNVGDMMAAVEGLSKEKTLLVGELQQRFNAALFNVETIEFDDREQVAIIFERINRAGKPLDTFELLSAWTWSTEFDLRESFEDLSSDLEPFGFDKIQDDENLLMKCCSAVIGGDASAKSIVNMKGPEVRERFSEIDTGIRGAIDFLRGFNIYSLEVMPYPAMIVPLATFFASKTNAGYHPTDKQRKELTRWFWKCCFSRRYSSGVGRAHAADIGAMRSLRADENKKVADFNCVIEPRFFLDNDFSLNSVNSKTMVLLLAAKGPKSLLSGVECNLGTVLQHCNKNEFHHVFPKAYLRKTLGDGVNPNVLANICFLSSADNKKIRDKAPSDYVLEIPEDSRGAALESHCISPASMGKSFEEFLEDRAARLVLTAQELIA